MNPFLERYHLVIIRIIIGLGVLLALFLLAATFSKFKEHRFIGSDKPATQTIAVAGKGEINRSPDTAKISFSVRAKNQSVKTAQTQVSTKVDAVTKALKNLGIEERHIKTDSYSTYPQYSYSDVTCMSLNCPRPGTPRISGYEVVHTMIVDVKDLDIVENVLGSLGTAGVSDIYGPNFGFEDDEAVRREARDIAIKDAREQAEALARSLGVRLVRIVSFSESGGGYPMPVYDAVRNQAATAGKAESAPSLPIGDQKITAQVTVTYEIR